MFNTNFIAMKKSTLLLVLIIFNWQPNLATAQTGKETINLSPGIKKGDWFELVFSQFHNSQIQNKWDIEPFIKKLNFRVTVLETKSGKINLQFEFDRFAQLEQSYSHVDTYYPNLNVDSTFSINNQLLFSVEITENGEKYIWKNSKNKIEYINVLNQKYQSIRNTGSAIGRESIKSDEITKLVNVFIEKWRGLGINQLPPVYGQINPVYNYWKTFQVKKSNILFPANSMFTLKRHKSIPLIFVVPKEDIFNNSKSITVNDSSSQHSCFLYKPLEHTITIGTVKYSFTLFPNDTISIEINEQKEISKFRVRSQFPGDANYFYEHKNDSLFENGITARKTRRMSGDEFIKLISKRYEKQTSLIEKYKNTMSPKVIYEVELDNNYWATYQLVRYEYYNKKNIDRENSFVQTVFEKIKPQFDYLYNLEYYHPYLITEFKRAKSNFQFDTPLTFQFEDTYFFARYSLFGYPLYYLSKLELQKLITHENLSQHKEQLNDFFKICKSPELLNEFDVYYKKAKFIQPETSIDSLNLNFKKSKEYIETNGKYKIIDFFSPAIGMNYYNQILDIYSSQIKVMGFQDKVEFLFYSPVDVEIPEEYNKRGVTIKVILQKEELIKSDQAILLDNYENLQIISPDNKIISSFAKQYEISEIIQKYNDAQNQPKSHEGRNAMLLGAFITLLGTTLIAWLIIKLNSRQIKKREAARRKLSELELKAIRSQMNPHFIFNAMGSIQNLINQNNTKNANLYLSSFARLMRMVLTNSNKKLVSLADELELLKNYLELEQLRVDFKFDISTSENIDPETEEIPGMLVQPFVENAVIHGITPKGKGNIEIRFSKQENVLVCEIIDDGVGIDTTGVGNGNGMAMKLSEKRLNLLNSQLQTKLRLRVENRLMNEKTEGTKITLLIPVG